MKPNDIPHTTVPTSPAQNVRLNLNGELVEKSAAARTHLADFVREQCGLTGTHLGCEQGVCGSCTVMLDGQPVRSCIALAAACQDRSVRTIEGYADDPAMAALRAAFSREHALQCGYCTPGMLATAYDIVRRLPDADEQAIRVELSGNLCRCTGYVGIVRAIQSVLTERRESRAADGFAEPNPLLAIVQIHGETSDSAFAGFVAKASSTPATALPALHAAPPAAASVAENRKGWSHIEDGFAVDFPPDQVWAFMSDVNALASCLPGAEILEQDGETLKGRIAIKFGPISAAFNGTAVLERNDAELKGTLRGAGTDSISHSRAKGDIGFRLLPQDGAQKTSVEITLDHVLQGPLAQFSRSGLVRNFVSHMIATFGRNLVARLGGATDTVNIPAKLNVPGMVASGFWNSLTRLLGKLTRFRFGKRSS
ncbi:MAG: carbon monoxide dehydrogenase small chain [Herminiimonas sp.]|nr:carbon monoxide dehydrogenase small chain [Herminiimonas sp.]